MATTHVLANPVSLSTIKSRLRDYLTLTKPEVNLLILMTTSAGFYLGSSGPMRIAGLVNTLIGTLLVASGTATLNQWMERNWDGQMRRTASRPLPSGRISPREAYWFGISVSTIGGLYLVLTVNWRSALLAIFTLLSYLLIYTPMKRKTPICTALGAIPGAMPTLIGWAGTSSAIGLKAWFLFALLFLWQFPHFLAIALMYREDYARAGYRMLPSFDEDSRFTRAEILGFTVVLIAVTMIPAVSHGRLIYFLVMAASGAYLLYYVAQLMQSTSRALASRVVHASVLYLPVVLAMMIAYKR